MRPALQEGAADDAAVALEGLEDGDVVVGEPVVDDELPVLVLGPPVAKALAKMKFDEEFLKSRDLSDLSADELAVLDDWADRFENKKLYPVVGLLPTFPAES